MPKSLLSFLIISSLLLSATGVQAETDSTSTSQALTEASETVTIPTVVPLKQLSVVGRLSLALGMTEAEVQAELDSGKTLPEVAEAHGMPISYYNSRILNSNFNVLSNSKAKVAVKKVSTKTIKKAIKPAAKPVIKKVTTTKKQTASKTVVKKTK